MKLKLWKWVGIAALPLAAVVTLPVVLTSCSSTSAEQAQNVDYQPDSATAEKFSKSDFEIVKKGAFIGLASTGMGTVDSVRLTGNVFEYAYTISMGGSVVKSILKTVLVPVSEGENAGKFLQITSAMGVESETWQELNYIKAMFEGFYNAGLGA